jgi:chemotaxis protein MotB
MKPKGDDNRIIVVRKVKKGGHGHHGGSWKVAYADFVTAMMAFFMVMWIVGLDDQTKRAISDYFSQAAGRRQGMASGASPIGIAETPVSPQNARIRLVVHMAEERAFQASAQRLRARMDSLAGTLGSTSVEVTVGDDGLRIELIEAGDGERFFARGSAVPKSAATQILAAIAGELATLHNRVIIEGHTDATRYGTDAAYSNWELSADRANAARRILQSTGLSADRVSEVRGMGDSRPRNTDDPSAPENRRISLLLPFAEVRADAAPRAD